MKRLPTICAVAFAGLKLAAVPCQCSFEEGLSGWSQASNVVIDVAVAHTGERSACLTVKNPKTENVYITRSLPVESGARYAASCYVKTENVRAAEGRDTSVGAGMIVEWTDEKGTYIGWGASTYNNFGTRDWFKVESGLLRPPAAARRALVHLALRGTGKAWFDDFALTRIEESVPKREPADGAVLTNNCPRLAWRVCPGVTNYMVQLSRRADFASGPVIEYVAGGRTCLQIEKPLSEGEWHWKVAFALALCTVVPEHTSEIMLRAQYYALNRVVCGHHWKSDIDASLLLASAMFANIVCTDEYQQQLVKAREEYKRVKEEQETLSGEGSAEPDKGDSMRRFNMLMTQ